MPSINGVRTNKYLSLETAKSGVGKDCQGKRYFCCWTRATNGTPPWAKTKRVNH